MNSTERMMNLLGRLPDDLLTEALEFRYAHRNRGKKIFFRIAVAACIMILFMTYVPAGQVLAQQLKIKIEFLLETFFPLKDITVYPEGEAETVVHEIYSNLEESQAGENKAGFAIYYDFNAYTATEEGDCYTIRPKRLVYTREDAIGSISALLAGLSEEEAEQKIQERMEEGQRFYDSMPVSELQIKQVENIGLEEAVENERQKLCEHYPIVSEIIESDAPKGLYFYAQEGDQANCEKIEIYFVGDGQGGVFQLTARYDVESEEGHGARFRAMIQTFEVYAITPSSEITEADRMVREFADAYFRGDVLSIQKYLTDDYPYEAEVYSDRMHANHIYIRAIKGLEQIVHQNGSDVSTVYVEFEQEGEEMQYLTIELVRTADGWRIHFYGREL